MMVIIIDQLQKPQPKGRLTRSGKKDSSNKKKQQPNLSSDEMFMDSLKALFRKDQHLVAVQEELEYPDPATAAEMAIKFGKSPTAASLKENSLLGKRWRRIPKRFSVHWPPPASSSVNYSEAFKLGGCVGLVSSTLLPKRDKLQWESKGKLEGSSSSSGAFQHSRP